MYSKKQFSYRIEKWGKSFRKNLTRAERNELLQNHPFPDHHTSCVEPRLKGGKWKNWRKTYMKDAAVDLKQSKQYSYGSCTPHPLKCH